MGHPKTIQWEKKLDRILRGIDVYLEKKYCALYDLHPVRARRKPTGNPQHDGLFRVTAAFSAGFGSEKGAGYIVRIEMMTLEDIDPEVAARIQADAAERLRDELPKAFPTQELKVEKDGVAYKMFGDLHLGKV
jgi:hypothetical protein